MQLTNEQQRLLRGMFPDEDGILREDVEQAIEEFLTAQTSSYRAAIEKTRLEHGTLCGGWHDVGNFEEDCCSECNAIREYRKKVLTLFTEGKV